MSADPRRCGEVRARAQPRHRGAAPEPAAAGHRRRQRADLLQAVADLEPRSEPQRRTHPTSQLQLSQGGGGVTNQTSPTTRGIDAELHLGRRHARGDAQQQPAGDEQQQRASSTRSSTRLERSTTRSRCCATSGSTRSAAAADRLAGQPRHLGHPAARVDHQHSSRTCGTPTGTTCSRRRRWRWRASRSSSRASSCRTTRSRVEVGTMAPIDVVQAQAEQATRRQGLVDGRERHGARPSWR